MAKNSEFLRTTTINLDEYNKLKSDIEHKTQLIGSLQENVHNLRTTISELKSEKSSKEPLVKVITSSNYSDYYDTVKFINLSETKELVKKELEKEYENSLKVSKENIKNLKQEIERLNDKLIDLERVKTKNRKDYIRDLEDAKDDFNDKSYSLQKAYNKDVKEYKETIKELNEEIKKIKSNKTDAEIEAKRNKEIETLKLRISDLEQLINDLNNTPWYKKIFKLRKISMERNEAIEAIENRKMAADSIGTTYVKENGKYRIYDNFKGALSYYTNGVRDWFMMHW